MRNEALLCAEIVSCVMWLQRFDPLTIRSCSCNQNCPQIAFLSVPRGSWSGCAIASSNDAYQQPSHRSLEPLRDHLRASDEDVKPDNCRATGREECPPPQLFAPLPPRPREHAIQLRKAALFLLSPLSI